MRFFLFEHFEIRFACVFNLFYHVPCLEDSHLFVACVINLFDLVSCIVPKSNVVLISPNLLAGRSFILCENCYFIYKKNKSKNPQIRTRKLMSERDRGRRRKYIWKIKQNKIKFIGSCRMFRFRDDFMWSPCWTHWTVYHWNSVSFFPCLSHCNYSWLNFTALFVFFRAAPYSPSNRNIIII